MAYLSCFSFASFFFFSLLWRGGGRGGLEVQVLLRRAQSHPNPRSPGSTYEVNPHDDHKRVNLTMISRPVLVPEGRGEEFEKLEEDDKHDFKQENVFTRRLVKNFGREKKKKKVKDGVVVFKGHPSWSIVLAFQVIHLSNRNQKTAPLHQRKSKLL